MQCSAVQCSAVQCSVWYWYGMVWYGIDMVLIWYGMVWYGVWVCYMEWGWLSKQGNTYIAILALLCFDLYFIFNAAYAAQLLTMYISDK